MDIVMFPFRLINAIFHFLNVFTMTFSGKPLTPGPNPARNDADPRKIMIHGNLLDAQKFIDDANKPITDKTPGIAPSSWKLIKFTHDGKEHELADGIISFDRAPDGTIYCCDGRQVFHLDENGKKTPVLKEKFIEKIYYRQGHQTEKSEGYQTIPHPHGQMMRTVIECWPHKQKMLEPHSHYYNCSQYQHK